MTTDKVSIRWKLCAYFILFTCFLLLMLWIMQTVLLDSIYAFYTKYTMKSHSEVIAENIDNKELNSLLISISQENEISIYLLNEDGIIKSATERSTSIRTDKASPEMYEYWELASENGGFYVTEVDSGGVFTDSGISLDYDPSHFTGNVPRTNKHANMIVASEVVSNSGEHSLLVLISRVDPLASTEDVIRMILSIASIIAFSMGIVLAYAASKGLASPIRKLSDSANQLALGDYDTVFDGGGCREITQLSSTLNDAARKLQKTDKLRKELLANVSHDLRTPLTMIGGYGEMMRDIPGENNPENIQIIIDEANRLTKLVNNALDLSKLQSGTFNYVPIVFCITDETQDISTQFEKLSGKSTPVNFISDRDVYVKADEILISEAIYNLMANAAVHGGENISITVVQTVTDSSVRISVKDNGRGIPKEQLDDIWERYQKGNGGGAGLGLAIVDNAMKLCGGSCGVESELGKGSEFWIELPVYKE